MLKKKIAIVLLCIVLLIVWQPVRLCADDNTPPVVTSTTPANGSSGFCPNAVITVHFNETILPGKNFNDIYILGTDGDANWGSPLKTRIIGNILQIKAVEYMPYGSRIEVRIPAASIMDLAGNSLQKEFIFGFVVDKGITADNQESVNNDIRNAVSVSNNESWVLTQADIERLLAYEYKSGVDKDGKELQALPTFTQKMKMYLDMAKAYIETMENYDYRTLSTAKGKEQYINACKQFPPGDPLTPLEERVRFIVENKLVKRSVFATSAELAYINKSFSFKVRGVEFFTLQEKSIQPDKQWSTALEEEEVMLNSLQPGVTYRRDIELSISSLIVKGENVYWIQKTETFYSDSTPPSVSVYPASGTIQPYDNIILKAEDPSGIRTIRYSWDNGDVYSWPVGTMTAIEVPTKPGRHVLRYQAQDKATLTGGNMSEWKTATYFVAPSSYPIVSWDNDVTVKTGISGLQQVSAGTMHIAALKNDGSVLVWGDNHLNQCEVPAGLPPVKKISSSYGHILALDINGKVHAWGWNKFGQCNVPSSLGPVVDVAAGDNFSAVLKQDGTVEIWGGDDTSVLPRQPKDAVSIKAIAAGYSHLLALTQNGSVLAWGDNSEGQCSVPSNLGTVTAIAAGNGHSVALKADGTVVAWGRNEWGQCNIPKGLKDCIAISASGEHTMALKKDGSIVAWGRNQNDECASPKGLSNITSIEAGTWFSLALQADGTLCYWGDTGGVQALIPTNSKICQVEIGKDTFGDEGSHILILREDGTVNAFGNSQFGASQVPAGLTDVKQIAAGDCYNLALKKDGTVVAWGYNGYNTCDIPAGLKNVKAIAAGGIVAAALLNDGTVVSWGRNARPVPKNLPKIKAISVGFSSVIALTENNEVVTWGTGFTAPSGLKSAKAVAAGQGQFLAVKSDGTVVAWGNTEHKQCDVPKDLKNVIAVSAYWGSSAALKSDGTVVCWGDLLEELNWSISDGPRLLKDIKSISVGFGRLVGLRKDGAVIGGIETGYPYILY